MRRACGANHEWCCMTWRLFHVTHSEAKLVLIPGSGRMHVSDRLKCMQRLTLCGSVCFRSPYYPLNFGRTVATLNRKRLSINNRRKRQLLEESLQLLHGRQSELPPTESTSTILPSFKQAVVGLDHLPYRMARHHQQNMGRDPGPGMYKEEPAPVADPVSIIFHQQQLSLPLFHYSLCFVCPIVICHLLNFPAKRPACILSCELSS